MLGVEHHKLYSELNASVDSWGYIHKPWPSKPTCSSDNSWACSTLRKTSVNYTKIGIERGNSYQKNENISGWKAQIYRWKLNWYISTITDVFLNQKRVHDAFTFFWLRITFEIVKTYQLCIHVFICAFHPEFSSIFCTRFLFLFLFACYPYFGILPFHMVSVNYINQVFCWDKTKKSYSLKKIKIINL